MKKIVLVLLASTIGFTSYTDAESKEPTWVTDKPVTLKIHMHFRDKYVYTEDWPVAKEAFRLTNVKLLNTASKAATNSREQFNLMMASGNLPDVVGGDSLKDDFIKYGMEGAFIPMNKLIDQHAPNLKAFFKTHPVVQRAITAPDGNIYFLPYVPDGKVARGWMMRKDWLEKLKLKEPQNIKELYAVLKAFREKDPNGNGKKDEIGFFDKEPDRVYNLVNFWGARASGSDANQDFYAEGGKVKHPWVQKDFREGMINIAKWYKEGLIDPEIFTRKSRAREQLYGANNGGLTYDWFASTYLFNETFAKTVPGFKVAAIMPPADSKGKRWMDNMRQELRPDGWAITKNNKFPVETIKMMDFYFGRVGRTLTNFGVEGQQYDMVKGKPVYKESVLKAKKPVNNQMYDIGAQIPIGFWQDYEYERQWTNADALKGIDMYTKANFFAPQFYGVNMTKDERAVYDKAWADIKTYMSETAQGWVLGSKDVAKTWDEYNAQLKRMGMDNILKVMQQAYDRQYKK